MLQYSIYNERDEHTGQGRLQRGHLRCITCSRVQHKRGCTLKRGDRRRRDGASDSKARVQGQLLLARAIELSVQSGAKRDLCVVSSA